jgi:hypothetical protein
MLENEFKYYLERQDDLVKEYNGRIIVIVNGKVVGVYGSKIDAYLDSVKEYNPGTFLIIECTPGADSYNIHQRSRIIACP